jgi:hypothetical protein
LNFQSFETYREKILTSIKVTRLDDQLGGMRHEDQDEFCDLPQGYPIWAACIQYRKLSRKVVEL